MPIMNKELSNKSKGEKPIEKNLFFRKRKNFT